MKIIKKIARWIAEPFDDGILEYAMTVTMFRLLIVLAAIYFCVVFF